MRLLTIPLLLSLSGCVAAPLVITGVGATSVAVNETTGRTITDQTVSAINGQDCRVSRAFQDQAVCQDSTLNQTQITNTNTKPSTVEEIQARYRQ
jgi:hypothetical protein